MTAAQQATAAAIAAKTAFDSILAGATAATAALAAKNAAVVAYNGQSSDSGGVGAGTTAMQAGIAAAAAAGMSTAQQAAAGNAAQAAASAAILLGWSNQAAAAAGAAAAAAAANGASAAAAATAGAGAGAGIGATSGGIMTPFPGSSAATGGIGTGPGGGAGSDLSNFCAQNPAAAVCKQSLDSTFAGTCSSGFTCSGDAIQCAIAQEQHQRDCTFYGPDSDPNSVFSQALSGADNKNMDAIKAASTSVSISNLDTSGSGWSRACPSDPVIPLGFGHAGSSLTIPFSRICDPLGILSNAGVGLTMLGALLWVLGTKKS